MHMELNKEQLEAVQDESNACLVNANVGSGKTTVLISKIRYLYEKKGVSLKDMMVLTFTNKAADEIRERLEPEKLESGETPWFGTFHSVALRMLQTILPVEELGYKSDFQVCLPEEELELAGQLIRQYNLNIKYKNRLKKRLEQAGRSTTAGKKEYQDDFAELFRILEEEKKKQNKMTYEDLLKNTIELLRSHPEIRRPDWIIIDEVQDCDRTQLALLEQLKKPETHLFAVGDPNQVIYSWRGSAFQIFYQLRNRYQARELTLSVNYRSSGNILAVSRRFQQNGSSLEGVREAGGNPVIQKHYDPFQEAQYLAEKIKSLHEQGIPYGEIAVFYRLQNQAEVLEKVFSRNQIPCQISVKKSLQDLPAANWFVHVLRFLSNHDDISSAEFVLCDKNYGEGWTERKVLKELTSLREGTVLCSASVLLQKMWEYEDTGRDYENLPDRLCLAQYLHPTSSSYKKDQAQIVELIAQMRDYGSIRDFLNAVTLNGISPEPDVKMEDAVRLMTLHASKGLEFSHVFIIGVNDGLIPLRCSDPDSEEEERRLFYVGMTRAKEYLEVSYYNNPDGAGVRPGPGRYLAVFPKEFTKIPEGFGKDPKAAAEHLQKMKRMVLEERKKTRSGLVAEDAYTTEKGIPENDISDNNISDNNMPENDIKEPETDITHIRVYHPKYGYGTVIKESEDMITVAFDDYGEKEMMKAFSMLQEIKKNMMQDIKEKSI